MCIIITHRGQDRHGDSPMRRGVSTTDRTLVQGFAQPVGEVAKEGRSILGGFSGFDGAGILVLDAHLQD
jgi:hypothetical protein